MNYAIMLKAESEMIAYVVHFLVVGYFALLIALLLDTQHVFWLVIGIVGTSSFVGWLLGSTPFFQYRAIEYTRKFEGLREALPSEKRLIIHAAEPVFKKANYPLKKINFMVGAAHMTVGKNVITVPENELKSLNSGVIAHELGHVILGHSAQKSCHVGACWSYYILRDVLSTNKTVSKTIVFLERLDAFKNRKKETQADLYATKLGFGEDFIEWLVAGNEIEPQYDWMRTHPTVEDRIRRIRQTQMQLERM